MPGNMEPPSPIKKSNDKVGTTESTPRPTLAQLYAMYGYEPAKLNYLKGGDPEQFYINPEVTKEAHRIIEQLLDSNDYGGDVTKEVTLGNIVFEARYKDINLPISIIGLSFQKSDTNITADLSCKVHSSQNPLSSGKIWTIDRRFISENLRGQDIGSNMLRILEHGIEHVASKEKTPQVVRIEARQAGVVNWALKNGYKPATKKDEGMLNLVYSGDKSQILITTDPSSFEDDPGRRLGAIYLISKIQEIAKEKGLGDLTADQIRSMDLRKIFKKPHPPYIESALTINFSKKVEPKV